MPGSAQEALLTVFGQKMTHAMRSRLSEKLCKLPASELTALEPGAVASRFIGDVDTVEALFTSGVVSMFADACRVISIFAVIAVRNIGLALLLIVILPVVFLFTRFIQKRMLASQLENRVAVAGVSGHVPETIRNIRTIHTLDKEKYMEDLYDERIDRSYRAVEKTNFCDAVYSPVITILNAATVGVVMLLSASGNASVLSFFGMSVGASVAVMNYIAGIFTPIESLGMEIQTVQSALAGAKRIDEFLNLPERNIPEHNADISPRPDISLNDVHFGYEDGKEILHGVSFRVSAGDQGDPRRTHGRRKEHYIQTYPRSLRPVEGRGHGRRSQRTGYPGRSKTAYIRICRTDLPTGSGHCSRSADARRPGCDEGDGDTRREDRRTFGNDRILPRRLRHAVPRRDILAGRETASLCRESDLRRTSGCSSSTR